MCRWTGWLGAVLLMLACTGPSGETVSLDATDNGTTVVDAVAEIGGTVEVVDTLDLHPPQDLLDIIFDLELIPDVGGPLCEAGEGCFLDPCTANEDCLAGWCVGHMGENVCTNQCQSECPPGWSCQQIPGTAPDVVFICISDHANLCLPCATGADCKGAAGADDVCVDYGDEGSFCGGACTSDESCPWGFSCLTTVTVDGIDTLQCVADAGVCPCTKKSVELALWTPCEIGNEFGICDGQRVCADSGLSDCDAQEPQAESCNGIDEDCDGDIDEPSLVEGKLIELCDDNNACTEDACKGVDGCSHEPLTGTECVDGNPCTVADHCDGGECLGTTVDCDDNNPCTDDSCDESGGCFNTDNTVDCDDDDPCSVADECTDGICVGTAIACDCQIDADCVPLEDGDLCNGTLVCDTSEVPFSCVVDESTEVFCPEPEGVDGPCLAALCDPVTAACSLEAVNDGLVCDDGDPCTIGDQCADGSCSPGVPLNCADDNVCTDDSCDLEDGCLHLSNQATCQDGDACTIGDLCAEGQCVSGEEKVCDDGNLCTSDSCEPGSGCVFAPTAGLCDDGNQCTQDDGCVEGSCVGGEVIDCDDLNPCTKDVCDKELGCIHNAVAGACDDGDPCTVNDTCVNGLCTSGAVVLCDDGNDCTADLCGEAGACNHDPVDGACDDGNACTLGDHCDQGDCVSSGLLACNDDNPCTTDSCDPVGGCLHLLNQAPCDDGDVCTFGDHCNLGECIGSGSLTCDDNNPCTADSCDPEAGCTFLPADDGECTDYNACTQGDKCGGGICLPGTLIDCDDDNLCTDDGCAPAEGCVYAANSVPCDDAELCTIGDHCEGGVCVGGQELDCDDQNPCTDDACDGVAGCIHTNNGVGCDDDNACTGNDVCTNGTCAGVSLDCDDEDVCTDDSCDPAIGCQYVHNVAPCDDGNECTTGDACANGSCVPGGATNCNDQVPCTTDSCDVEQGCLHVAQAPCCSNGIVEAGESCDDGNLADGDGCSSQCQNELNAQCYKNYSTLNQNWRNVNYGNGSTCDSNLSGWYRFQGAAGTKMSDSAPPVNHCNTDATGWLKGGHPSVNAGVVTRTACFNWVGNSCWHTSSIQVVNCKDFYLYKLGAPGCCSCVYCGTN